MVYQKFILAMQQISANQTTPGILKNKSRNTTCHPLLEAAAIPTVLTNSSFGCLSLPKLERPRNRSHRRRAFRRPGISSRPHIQWARTSILHT